MTINNFQSISAQDLQNRVKALLSALEENSPTPYRDGATPANPTIGIGFNLNAPTTRNLVFSAMGLTLDQQNRVNAATGHSYPSDSALQKGR